MPLPKTSKAEVLSFRLNPINPDEDAVLRIINEYGRDKMKQLIVASILQSEGIEIPQTAEERRRRDDRWLLENIENRFEEYVKEVLKTMPKMGFPRPGETSDESDEEISEFSRNLAKGLLKRTKQSRHQEEDEDA